MFGTCRHYVRRYLGAPKYVTEVTGDANISDQYDAFVFALNLRDETA